MGETMMYSQMFRYPIVKSSFKFVQIPLKKSITERVSKMGRINSYNITMPRYCDCDISPQHVLRLNDVNGSRGTPCLQELFDFRPCYLHCFQNLWDFYDCFEYILLSNVFNNNLDLVRHDIRRYGMQS